MRGIGHNFGTPDDSACLRVGRGDEVWTILRETIRHEVGGAVEIEVGKQALLRDERDDAPIGSVAEGVAIGVDHDVLEQTGIVVEDFIDVEYGHTVEQDEGRPLGVNAHIGVEDEELVDAMYLVALDATDDR